MFSLKQKKDIGKIFSTINKNEEFEIMFNNYRRDNKLSIVKFMTILKYMKWRSDTESLE